MRGSDKSNREYKQKSTFLFEVYPFLYTSKITRMASSPPPLEKGTFPGGGGVLEELVRGLPLPKKFERMGDLCFQVLGS